MLLMKEYLPSLQTYSSITHNYLVPLFSVLLALDGVTTYIGLQHLDFISERNPIVVALIDLLGLELTVLLMTIPPIIGLHFYFSSLKDTPIDKSPRIHFISNTTLLGGVLFYSYIVINNILVLSVTAMLT